MSSSRTFENYYTFVFNLPKKFESSQRKKLGVKTPNLELMTTLLCLCIC